MFAQHAEVQEHVTVYFIADKETESTRRVEPFHSPANGLHLGRTRAFVRLHYVVTAPFDEH
jgi:hypothetical protein